MPSTFRQPGNNKPLEHYKYSNQRTMVRGVQRFSHVGHWLRKSFQNTRSSVCAVSASNECSSGAAVFGHRQLLELGEDGIAGGKPQGSDAGVHKLR